MEGSSSHLALLSAARRWRSARRVVILKDGHGDDREGREPTDDILRVKTGLEACGLRVDFVEWERLADEHLDAAAVLPLMTWSYVLNAQNYSRFIALLKRCVSSQLQPLADLRVLQWTAHKRFLLELSDAGVDVVPTCLLPVGTAAAGVRSALRRLGKAQPTLMRDADQTCVVKPALGGGGDGVELLHPGDQRGEQALLGLLETREMLVQPFLPLVRTEGEIALVFVNEVLLHAVLKVPCGWGSEAADEGEAAAGEGGDAVRRHAASLQPVCELSQPPEEVLATARRALGVVRERACAPLDGPLYLARVDLLPARSSRAAGPPRWLVSEVEVGWPHLFLRAAGDREEARSRQCAEGLLRHLDAAPAVPPDVLAENADDGRACERHAKRSRETDLCP